MREFGYPLPYDDFWELCDPNPESCFHKPFIICEGETGMANRWMMLTTTQAVHDSDKRENEEAREKAAEMNWGFFDYPKRGGLRPGSVTGWERNWKMLRDRGGMLAGPELAAWEPTIDPERRGGFDFVSRPRLTVGVDRVLVPLPTLQLMRRLPNCEVFVGGENHGAVRDGHGKIYFRFTGGRGVAFSVRMKEGLPWDGEREKYGVWTPKVDQGLATMERGI